MSSYFENIAPDYISAEITSLFLHDKKLNRYFNLLTLIELIPSEQEASPLVGVAENKFLARQNVDDDYVVFLIRVIDYGVNEAISKFKNSPKSLVLEYESLLKVQIDFFDDSILEQEPVGEYPLLINKDVERTIGVLLPYRDTGFRVWTKIDRRKAYLDSIDPKIKTKILKKSSVLTNRHLNFDIFSFEEHLGNIYLFACNPYARNFELSLMDHNRDLYINFYERVNKTIDGCKIVFQDERAGNTGFYLEKLIKDGKSRFHLPNFPFQLVTTLFDKNNYPLSRSSCNWNNIKFGIGIQETVLNIATGKGKKISIPKYSDGGSNKIGVYDHSLTTYLYDHQKMRYLLAMKDTKQFAFFPGSDEDIEEARIYISELIGKSSKLCFLLDPYFSDRALFYAYVTSRLSVPIRILASAFYLKKKVNNEDQMSLTHGELLLERLKEYKEKMPLQIVECRVLRGNSKSQLHDRYIVSDDDVYLLGSSFHEFGGRATTIVKVPAPKVMIEKAHEWWSDEFSIGLELFVDTIKMNSDEA